ncbi:alkaline phosphatase D family protein [Arthrobacter crystallopoietes]|uniref:PhoD-like phosphatase n=1 Tax=Crystallibacter crystallopoietes TaxID=37928 RepID=A0A1H1AHN3_9MICC|nr:alkaline phosphatase D family protein [Arthrobacter crystallopoietes]AUI51526.1 glycoside hydrolase [Arthrobacter crystallopoietes]SDQ39172.1 PhoD-like phosphatase [Arthrobacter crystallopoietes]
MTTSPLVLGPMMRYVDQTTASIWVETRDAARVAVRAGGQSWEARTFAVHHHHYALVEVAGLEPGSVTPYTVEIDGEEVWPATGAEFPPSCIATLKPDKPLRLEFGTCRTSVPHDKNGNRTHGVDSMRAYALEMAKGGDVSWPDLLLFLGDQVYADSTSDQMQEFIKARRDMSEPPGEELKDYEEYAHLYSLAWSDEANRWLLSTLPSAMIFDDHDIRDDWNASLTWKQQMQETSWWHGRIVSGLASYWVYQHLGNLSPQQRADDVVWRLIAKHRGEEELDLSEALDAFAEKADHYPESYRWSFSRDIGGVRLIVLDSRAARVLEPEHRSLLDGKEMAWLDGRLQGGFRHVLVATSLPFLLPTGLHHLESWNEALSEGVWGKPAAKLGEKLRQAIDLEHWGAFQKSFQEVAAMVLEVADGQRGPAPETVTFLSGDVHFSYVAEVQRPAGSRIVQAVCSPIRNPLPRLIRSFTAIMSYGVAGPVGALMARSAKVPDPPFRWETIKGPWFDNNLAGLEDSPDGLKFWWQTGIVENGDHDRPRVQEVAAVTLPPRGA